MAINIRYLKQFLAIVEFQTINKTIRIGYISEEK